MSNRRPIRCMAIDMDGTLLTSDGEVSVRNATALKRIRADGILPIICTGKIPGPWQDTVTALKLDAPTIFLQGALVRDADGKILLEKRLTIKACQATLNITDTLEDTHGHEKICCLACIGGEYYCAGKSPMARQVPLGLLAHGEPEPHALGAPLSEKIDMSTVNKFVILMEKSLPGLDCMASKFRQVLRDDAVLVTYSDNKYLLEVSPAGVSKGETLSLLLPRLGMELDEMLAIGDGSNDLSMIELAGLGVAMGNAAPDVISAADVVVGSNDEDGVAEAISKYVLQDHRIGRNHQKARL